LEHWLKPNHTGQVVQGEFVKLESTGSSFTTSLRSERHDDVRLVKHTQSKGISQACDGTLHAALLSLFFLRTLLALSKLGFHIF
jgi:hypothetical protein